VTTSAPRGRVAAAESGVSYAPGVGRGQNSGIARCDGWRYRRVGRRFAKREKIRGVARWGLSGWRCGARTPLRTYLTG
jgi:hypothetical protein